MKEENFIQNITRVILSSNLYQYQKKNRDLEETID